MPKPKIPSVNVRTSRMTFKEWVLELFEDEREHVSIKPVIGLMGSIFLCVTMVLNGINGSGFNPSDAIIEAVMFITMAGMGADTVDKFSNRRRHPRQSGGLDYEENSFRNFDGGNNFNGGDNFDDRVPPDAH